MFSTLYGATVATFPKAIFLLGASLVSVCVGFLVFLRAVVESAESEKGDEEESDVHLLGDEARI